MGQEQYNKQCEQLWRFGMKNTADDGVNKRLSNGWEDEEARRSCRSKTTQGVFKAKIYRARINERVRTEVNVSEQHLNGSGAS